MQAMPREAHGRADFAGGAKLLAISVAFSLRTTVEETLTRDGQQIDAVRGRLLSTGKQAAMYVRVAKRRGCCRPRARGLRIGWMPISA